MTKIPNLLIIFLLMVILLMERTAGLPILTMTIFLAFSSKFEKNWIVVCLWILAGLFLSAAYSVMLAVGVFEVSLFGSSYFYLSGNLPSPNRRIALLVGLFILGWWPMTGLAITSWNVIYHLGVYLLAIAGVYLITGWKIRWRGLQLSRRFKISVK